MLSHNKNMKKGFSMIELIFVIVIIGILAGVAIPKISANRDDAIASVCASAFATFIKEVAAKKAAVSFNEFKRLEIQDITNLKVLSIDATNQSDFDFTLQANKTGGLIHNQSTSNPPTDSSEGVNFLCEGAKMAWVYTDKIGREFPLIIKNIYQSNDINATPAGDKASKYITNQYNFDANGTYNIY